MVQCPGEDLVIIHTKLKIILKSPTCITSFWSQSKQQLEHVITYTAQTQIITGNFDNPLSPDFSGRLINN